MKRGYRVLIATILAVLTYGFAPCLMAANTEPAKETKKTQTEATSGDASKEPRKQPWDQKPSVTHHSMTIKGRSFTYTATTGYMPLADESGKPAAYVFFISYTLDQARDTARRPLTFAFNGGPGAASVWLHMAAIGPKRVVLSDEGRGLPPPYAFTANEETWLDFTDLVFIDPVGTGYSRPAEGIKSEEFLGVQKDIESVGQFIRLYCTRYERWLAPKFLVGESYGTTRAAGLSKYLQDKAGMALNGIVFISTAINFQTISQGPDNDLAYALSLPAYAVAAAYHKRLSPSLLSDPRKTRKEVESFALTEYLPALARGYDLPAAERETIVEKLAAYTGLKQQSIRNSNLRIDGRTFARQLLEEKGLHLGLYDSRFTANYRYRTFMEDPSIFEVTAPMLSACNDYLRRELKYESDLPYEFLSDKTHREWNWGSAGSGYVDTATSLAMALNQNSFLKIFVACGHYDLVTSYFAAKYTFNRMGPDADLRGRITLEYYENGHQLYMDRVSRQKLKEDGSAFFRKTLHSGSDPVERGASR
jgi:carboxypeptidase C (cathepsin A)